MPTIVFVSPKGGAGKTTSALVLAEQIARSAPVTVIDADPNHPIQTWAAGPNTPANLSVVAHADEENVIEMRHALGHRTFVGEGRAYQRTGRQQRRSRLQIPLHFHDFSLSIISKEIQNRG